MDEDTTTEDDEQRNHFFEILTNEKGDSIRIRGLGLHTLSIKPIDGQNIEVRATPI